MAASLRVLPASLGDNGDVDPELRPKAAELRHEIMVQVRELLRWTSEEEGAFKAFEEALAPRVFLLVRLLVMLFLCCREKKVSDALPKRIEKNGKRYQRRRAQPRNLSTAFGVVRYWRSYCRGPKRDEGQREGFYPLDVELGLTGDRLSMPLTSKASRLSTKLSFAEAREVLTWFVPNAPSTEVIEKTVLGLGAHTEAWFESAPAPEDDGEVLVVQIDGKAVPTATDSELERRRGKREPPLHPNSPRHRGRSSRARYDSPPRRKKGDKSKNGKVANVVVMYTLRRSADGDALLGPVNKRIYASFANKRHAFAFARREANKRGFTQDSGKTVQFVTDGDDDFARYAAEYLPEATHTIDIIHVIERLWDAGQCLHKEASDELRAWVEKQKTRLYEGKQHDIVAELQNHYARIPRTGPGNKGKRKRLQDVIRYLEKRLDKMNYDDITAQDLELASGAVEGAVKHVVGLRFDHGGMRWIKERAEALLKLRCIDINGEWDAFIDWVHDQLRAAASAEGKRVRLQTNTPEPLPNLAEAS